MDKKLINELKRLIMHAENGSLDYSILEHARKLVFHAEQDHNARGKKVLL